MWQTSWETLYVFHSGWTRVKSFQTGKWVAGLPWQLRLWPVETSKKQQMFPSKKNSWVDDFHVQSRILCSRSQHMSMCGIIMGLWVFDGVPQSNSLKWCPQEIKIHAHDQRLRATASHDTWPYSPEVSILKSQQKH